MAPKLVPVTSGAFRAVPTGTDVVSPVERLDGHVRLEGAGKGARIYVDLFQSDMEDAEEAHVSSESFPATKEGARAATDYLRARRFHVEVLPPLTLKDIRERQKKALALRSLIAYSGGVTPYEFSAEIGPDDKFRIRGAASYAEQLTNMVAATRDQIFGLGYEPDGTVQVTDRFSIAEQTYRPTGTGG